jgi:putative chitobiose transport system permease protein
MFMQTEEMVSTKLNQETHKTKFSARIRPALIGYAFLAPAILVLGLVFLYPIVEIIRYSFSMYQAGTWTYVGFLNYQNMFSDSVFLRALTDNLKLLIAVPILAILGIFFAILIFERGKFWKTHRFVVFLPYILAIPVVGVVFEYLFQYNGIINEFLRAIHLNSLAVDWLGSPKYALSTLMLVIVWKELGFAVVLFLARLLSVPEDLYEAAKLDGAGWWKMHMNVSIPQLRSVIRFYIIIEMITMLSWVFGYVYVMTNGGPANSTMVSELYIYQMAFHYNNSGLASAVGVVLLLISCVFIAIQFVLSRGEK